MSYEFATLEVQNVILHPNLGLFSSDDAVSKTYVDAKVDTAISSLINSAPATLDTLKEIATALNNDANLATTLANSISSEATSRAVADTLLSSQITALSTSSAAALASETAARTAADATLTSALNAEVSLRSTQKTAQLMLLWLLKHPLGLLRILLSAFAWMTRKLVPRLSNLTMVSNWNL